MAEPSSVYIITLPFAFVFGLIIGSFLNVCIYRIPLKKSLLRPRSNCPYCNQMIQIKDNIPLLSYFLLKGKCRNCGGEISPVYPLVEFITGLLFIAITLRFGVSWHALVYMILVSILVIATVIDLKLQIIPDRLTYPGMVAGFILAVFSLLPINWADAVLGGWVGSMILYVIALISQGGMGGGDIKFIAVIGLFLGWENTLLTLFLATFIGAIVGLGLMAVKGYGRKAKVPFGPFLALGALISVFWGQQIIEMYFSFWPH